MPIEIYAPDPFYFFGFMFFYIWCVVPFIFRVLKMDEAKRKTIGTYLVLVPPVGALLAVYAIVGVGFVQLFVFELIDLGA